MKSCPVHIVLSSEARNSAICAPAEAAVLAVDALMQMLGQAADSGDTVPRITTTTAPRLVVRSSTARPHKAFTV